MATEKPTLTEFRASFPELSSHSDVLVQLALDDAIHLHDRTKRGILLCAAHLVSDEDCVEILSSKQGPVSVMFQEYDKGTFWATTPYGRQLRELECRLPPVIVTVY